VKEGDYWEDSSVDSRILLSRVWVRIGGVLTGNRIYCTLTQLETITLSGSLTPSDECFQSLSSLLCMVKYSSSGRSSVSGLASSQAGDHLTQTSRSHSPAGSGPDSYSSKSYVESDGQSASLSWCQAPTWGPDSC
jgi:hypothetical protein